MCSKYWKAQCACCTNLHEWDWSATRRNPSIQWTYWIRRVQRTGHVAKQKSKRRNNSDFAPGRRHNQHVSLQEPGETKQGDLQVSLNTDCKRLVEDTINSTRAGMKGVRHERCEEMVRKTSQQSSTNNIKQHYTKDRCTMGHTQQTRLWGRRHLPGVGVESCEKKNSLVK